MKKTTELENTKYVKLTKVISKTGKTQYYLAFQYSLYFKSPVLEALKTLGLAGRVFGSRIKFRNKADALSALTMILLTIQ